MNDYNQALEEAELLSRLTDSELLIELGVRAMAAGEQPEAPIAQAYSGDFAAAVPDMGAVATLRKIGEKWWAKLEPELMALVCQSDHEDMKKLTSGKSIPQIAAGLATAGVLAVAAAPPAWIIVAATIIAGKLAETGVQALCETWQEERGGKDDNSEGGEASGG